ncbi:MAG: polysaccharide biosynthesis tyrosine autokinase, partial [Armatimonadetes bacterium]|nr:polysaccharide biosynthesis tyrosine autokinase [Armatimonadota bacterium]
TLRSHLRALRIREQIPPLVTQVLEEARVPSEPVSQGRAQYLVAFAVMAAALGLGAALLQDHLDDRIRTPDDVERASQLVSLGHVPFLDPTESGIVLDGSARSPVAEAYRALRASVDFAAMEGQVRRLLVTSPNKSEGKSVTSVNLAAAMAFNGKRVVLVDADLRRPSLHRVFGLSQERGLSQVLAGQLEVSEALQTTSRENLWVLTSGPLPHNPAELLGSPRLDQLLDCLAGIADFVILDSPPCLPVADPLVVASRVDAVLLVVHAGHTRRPALRHVRQLLQRAHARLLGVVMNRVEPGRRGDYYYSSYYYGYGYETESRGPTRGPGCGRMPFDSPSPTAEFGPGRERVGETTDGPTQSAA